MSKIGKKLITVPNGVDINISDNSISIKGPKGELKRVVPDELKISKEATGLKIKPANENYDRQTSILWGLNWALIKNMVEGVSKGFEKVLEFQGVGYKAVAKGNELELELGYSHPVSIKAPEGISFKVEKNTIKIAGIDKDLVGKIAAEIRSKRKPEPYQGSGIKYQDEIIKKKAGKKAVASGT